MKILKHVQMIGLAALLAATANVQALPIGMTNITIFDGDNNTNTDWYGVQEDHEVEPGMDKHQKWDLESFSSYGQNKLAMIGGFDFKNGVAGYTGINGQKDFRSGDIFIDINNNHIAGNAQANDGNGHQVGGTFGYDFVLDVDWMLSTYQIIELTANSKTLTAYYDANYGSSPWKYVSDGIVKGAGTFSYESGLSDALTGFSGGSHYAASGFDLNFLGNTDYVVHFTEGCGNDNLMGEGRVQVAEPGSMALLVLGALGLVVMRRRVNR